MSEQDGKKAVDAYIAAAPKVAQPRLGQLRKLIKDTAPKATERLSYGMPHYEYKGRLIYFSAFKNHIGVYPVGEAAQHDLHLDGVSCEKRFRHPHQRRHRREKPQAVSHHEIRCRRQL